MALLALLQPLVLRHAGGETFCTVTINSPDEREALRRAFPGRQFVELTDYAPANDTSGAAWLAAACHEGIQCDVLLISGHFANRFFGSTPFDLPIATLEQRSCEARCDGVLKRPKLVFLFGCNSLASKRPDRRTPAQYREILVEDGLDPGRADRAVALRYYPLGDATRARIQKVFSPGTLVFGFSSISPLGADAGPRLTYFLRQTKPLIEETLSVPAVRPAARKALRQGWTAAFRGRNPESIEGGLPLTENECRFRQPGLPRPDRLLSAERLLADAPVENALLIHDFLSGESDWNANELAVLFRMKDNDTARHEVLETLAHLPESREVYFSMLQLARLLDWLDDAQYEKLEHQRLHAMLADGVTRDERDFLCSSDLSYVPPADVLAANRRSLELVRALPCLTAQSASMRRFLLGRLSNGTSEARLAVLDALRELELLLPSDVNHLQAMYAAAPPDLKEGLLWALALADGANVDVQRFIGAAAVDPNAGVAWTSAQVLKQLRPTDDETLRALARALGSQDGFVRRGVALALEAIGPHSADVLEDLRRFLLDPDPIVRESVTDLVTRGGPTVGGN